MITKKKSVVILFSIITIITVLLFVIFKNRDVSANESPLAKAMIESDTEYTFLNFEENLLNEDGVYYLWFCDTSDTGCAYIENEFITPTLNLLEIDQFENFYKIDFKGSSLSAEKLLNKYNVNSTLALVVANVENSKVSYESPLVWNEDEPFTHNDFKEWLYKNNIFQQAYNLKTP